MSERRVLPLAALVAVALFALAFALSLVPWLARDRQIISSTPTSLSATALTDLRLRSGALLCVSRFGLDDSAAGLQIMARDVAKTGITPPLRVEVQAQSYRSVARLAGGYPFDIPVVVPLRAPTGDVDDVRVCIRNEGKAMALVGTKEPRDLSQVRVRLDGKEVVVQPWLTFVERRPASVLERSSEILDRVAAFRPFPAVPLLLGMLAVLVLVGVPLAVVSALALAQRADGKDR